MKAGPGRAFILFAAWLIAYGAHGSDRPRGLNCAIQTPPEDAGEDSHMYAGAFKIYPRAKNMEPRYSGCQIIWRDKNQSLEKWELLAVLILRNGELVGSWSPMEEGASLNNCKYAGGRLASGDPGDCYRADIVPLKSMKSGCLSDMLKASYDRSLPLPNDCLEYE